MRVNKDLELNIIVCIKQVPETTEVEFDKETGRLIREGVAAVVNPFDEYAIEEGIRLVEKYGGRVKVITMGPPWAESALKDAIAMGADEGFLATDMAFAGADRVQSGMRNSFGRSTGVCARVRAGQIICDVGASIKNLNLVRDRLRIASMKVPSSCQIVILKYKSPEFLKRSGLPLYDDQKRREIPLYEIIFEESSDVATN